MQITRFFDRLKSDVLRPFFSSTAYPVAVGVIAFLGHMLGADAVSMTLLFLLGAVSLFVTGGVLALVPTSVMFIYSISRVNSPGVPSFSDHYFEVPVIIFLSAACLIFVISLLVFLPKLRRKVDTGRYRAVFISALVLAFAMLVGGFGHASSVENAIYGGAVGISFVLPLYIFLVGLSIESRDSVLRYYCRASLVTVVLLLGEILLLYLGKDTPVSDFGIEKSQIVFGWGIWNSMGMALATLIPLCLLGVLISRAPALYFCSAALAYVGVVLTLSRGAFLFATAAYVISLGVIALLRRKNRFFVLYFRLFTLSLALGVIFVFVRSPELVISFFDDNGRFALYARGIEDFLSAPLFGVGFFGFSFPEGEGYFTGGDFIPAMAHTTPVTLLSSSGLFGFAAYCAHRFLLFKAAFLRLDHTSLLLLLSGAVMLGMSLLDNFVFQIWPLIQYSASVAIALMPDERPDLTLQKK